MTLMPKEKIKFRIFDKKKVDEKYSLEYPERTTEELINYGIINIDKPQGPTSHQVSDYVQKILGINKAGHSGTLDPAVTGVLPIALGRATKIVQLMLLSGKEYVGIMHLHKNIERETLEETIKKNIIGKIRQIPPVKSSVRRIERTREIYYFEILEMQGRDVLFKVGCEAGTYIRKLCFDIGVLLSVGANMSELRRTKAGAFNEKSIVTLHELIDAFHYYKNENNEKYLRKIIQPVENALKHIPKIWALGSAMNSLCHGSDLKVPGIGRLNDNIKKNDVVAILSYNNELIALGKSNMSSEEIIDNKKGIAVITQKVFISPSLNTLNSENK